MEYPKRSSNFAHKHFRLMTKVCAAQEIGPTAMLLVGVIVHQEDTIRYSRAVTFYNEQLQPLIGVNGRKALAVARDKAVAAGWLHYEPGGKSKAGKYWVLIPEYARQCDDSPIGESADIPTQQMPDDHEQQAKPSQTITSEMGRTTGREQSITGKTERTSAGQLPDNGAPFNPTPNPYPKDRKELSVDSTILLTSSQEVGSSANSSPTPSSSSNGSRSSSPIRRSGSGVFSKVDSEVLRDNQRLRAWFEWQTTQPRPVFSLNELTETNWHNVLATAQKSLDEGKKPPALFAAIVGKGDWKKLSDKHDDAAHERLREWRNQQARSPNGTSNGTENPAMEKLLSTSSTRTRIPEDDIE